MSGNLPIRGLTPAERQSEYITIGGATFKTEDVEGYSQKGVKQNSVFLKNGVQISYPGQASAKVTVEKSGVLFGGFSGGVIKGTDKSDNITLFQCKDMQVDIQGGNGILGLGGDEVSLPDGNKNITVKKDWHDHVHYWDGHKNRRDSYEKSEHIY